MQVLIFIAILEIILFVVLFLSFRTMIGCYKRQNKGQIYVKVESISGELSYGWLRYNDITAIRNNKRALESMVEMECGNSIKMIRVGELKNITQIKNVVLVIVGNLY